MDAETKAKWVSALRSGEYKQCTGFLQKDEGFCCLGVLADQLGMPISKDGMGIRREGLTPSYGPIWVIVSEQAARKLAEMNDTGSTFAGIADYIEREMALPTAKSENAP